MQNSPADTKRRVRYVCTSPQPFAIDLWVHASAIPQLREGVRFDGNVYRVIDAIETIEKICADAETLVQVTEIVLALETPIQEESRRV